MNTPSPAGTPATGTFAEVRSQEQVIAARLRLAAEIIEHGLEWEINNTEHGRAWWAPASGCGILEYLKYDHFDIRIKPKPEKWAAEMKAFEEGKTIQFRYDGETWRDFKGATPAWDVLEWRVKPEPKLIPLGPEDISPGSVVRHRSDPPFCFRSIDVECDGIRFTSTNIFCPWKNLAGGHYEIKRPGEDWKPCSKEAAE